MSYLQDRPKGQINVNNINKRVSQSLPHTQLKSHPQPRISLLLFTPLPYISSTIGKHEAETQVFKSFTNHNFWVFIYFFWGFLHKHPNIF